MNTLKCEICNRSLFDHIALFRVNPLGETPAIWRCREHFEGKVDPEADRIVVIIEDDNDP